MLPPEIGQLQNLKHLDIQNNNLTELPAEIGNLSNLQILRIANNQLTNLPPTIKQLKNLKELNLWGNPISPEEQGRIKALLPRTQIKFGSAP